MERSDHGFDETATIQAPVDLRPMANRPRFVLDVEDGPNRGKTLVVDASRPSRATIGKAASCDLVLDEPEVSRRHAAVDIDGSVLRLVDLKSTNGTYVNGLRVYEVGLSGGESIRIGASVLRVKALEREAESPLVKDTAFGRLIGASEEMRRLYPLCQKLADAEVPVVIEGETGTGKEVLAEALHEKSKRSGVLCRFRLHRGRADASRSRALWSRKRLIHRRERNAHWRLRGSRWGHTLHR